MRLTGQKRKQTSTDIDIVVNMIAKESTGIAFTGRKRLLGDIRDIEVEAKIVGWIQNHIVAEETGTTGIEYTHFDASAPVTSFSCFTTFGAYSFLRINFWILPLAVFG